jgi:hypothetical protein
MDSKKNMITDKFSRTYKKLMGTEWRHGKHLCTSQIGLIVTFEDSYSSCIGARGSLVVKALGYKPEGRGFETRWGEILI